MSTTLHVYTTPPQMEHKALEECHRAGIKVRLPRAKLRKPAFGRVSAPVAPGYIFAEGRPPETPYMRVRPDGKPFGRVTEDEIKGLWKHARVRQRPVRTENPFKVGDEVVLSAYSFTDVGGNVIEVRGEVLEVRGRSCRISFEMAHKVHTQAISYTQLRPG